MKLDMQLPCHPTTVNLFTLWNGSFFSYKPIANVHKSYVKILRTGKGLAVF